MTGPAGAGPATIVVRAPDTYRAERRYVLDVVLGRWLGLEYVLEPGGPGVTLEVAGDRDARLLTLPDVLFSTPAEHWLTPRSMPVRPLRCTAIGEGLGVTAIMAGRDARAATTGSLPAIFGDETLMSRPWRRSPTELALPLDVFGGVFFLLTRYEELVNRSRDEHGRFPARASLAAGEGFLGRPLADEYAELLWMALHELWPAMTRRASPFQLRLTHDVDWPWAVLGQRGRAVSRAMLGDLARRHDPGLAFRRARAFVDARAGRVDRDPFNTFDLLMDASERRGLGSTFYFMAGRTNPVFDGSYRLSDRPVAGLLARILCRGHEVGLHASYGTHLSAERIRDELDTLQTACRAAGFEQETWGVRQHYLRFESPLTWRHQDAAGLDHDSTLAFADDVGFRAGTCREFPVFDLLARERLGLLERPLVAMDATLFGYLHLGSNEARDRTVALVDACRRHGGVAVLLFHNSWLAPARQRAFYLDLIDELVAPSRT